MGVSLGTGARTSVNIIIFSPWNLTVSYSAIISTYNKVGPPVFSPSFYENRCSSLPHQSHAWSHFKMCFRKQLAQSTQLRISFSFFFLYFFTVCVCVCVGWRMQWWRRRCFSINARKGHKKQMEYHCVLLPERLWDHSSGLTLLKKTRDGTHRSRINIFWGQVELICL